MRDNGFAWIVLILLLAAWFLTIGVWHLLVSSHRSLLSGTKLEEVQSSSVIGIDYSSMRATAATLLEETSRYPFLLLVPIERTMSSFNPTTSQKFSYEGITLTLPWPGSPTIQSRLGVGTQIRFPDGNFVLLVNPYPLSLIRQEFLSAGTSSNQAKLNYLFGESKLQSNEVFFDTVFSSSPAHLSSSALSLQGLAESMLLPIKLAVFFDLNTQAIYKSSTTDFRVFEFTDLPIKDQSYIVLFDAKDNGRLLTTSANQKEIDYIVKSIHNQ